jgi:hypothetical protein
MRTLLVHRPTSLLVLALVIAVAISAPGCKESSSSPTGPGAPADDDEGTTGLGGAVEALAVEMYGSGEDATEFATESIDIAARAVWVATEATGNPDGTFTGTLTQAGEDAFTYDATPADRMRVFLSGLADPIEITYTAFAGYVEGSWQDFRDYHDDLGFRVTLGEAVDLTLTSQARPGRGPATERGDRTAYDRTLQGTVLYDGVPLEVDLRLVADTEFDISGTFSSHETYQEAVGTITTPTSAITVREAYQYKSVIGDNAVQNYHLWNESSAVLDGTSYAYVDVYVRREFTNGSVFEPEYWLAEGGLVRDGSVIGQVTFDGAAVPGTSGPRAHILLADGQTLPLESVVIGRQRLRSGWWLSPGS